MKSVNELFGKKRETRKRDYNDIELRYKESLLFLLNEEVEEYVKIITLITKGELKYDLQLACIHLQKLEAKRQELLADIEHLKIEINDEDEDEYI